MNRFVILLVAFAAVAVTGRHHSSSSSSSSEGSHEKKAISYEKFLKNPKNLYTPNTSPEWLKWDLSNMNLPTNAVFAGFSPDGASYIIRADHTTPQGVFVGKLIGKYFPYFKTAYVGYNGVEYTKTNFELMLHNRPIWTERDDRRPLIEGSNGNFVCRVQHDNYWTPGRIENEMRFCTYPWKGGEVTSPSFQTLRRMC